MTDKEIARTAKIILSIKALVKEVNVGQFAAAAKAATSATAFPHLELWDEITKKELGEAIDIAQALYYV